MPGAFIQNDIATLLVSSEFGEASGDVTWKGNQIAAIFDNADTEVPTGDDTMILQQPMITCASVSVPGIAEGDAVTVRSVPYRVDHWIDDGTGMIEIFLKDAA